MCIRDRTQKQSVIDSSNAQVNSIMLLLDKKRSEVTALPHYTAAHKQLNTNSVAELARVYEVIDLYNQLMSSYLSNSCVQTTQLVQSSVRRLLAYIAPIARGLSRLIETYVANVNANRANIQEYFAKLVFALAAYDLLEEQLRSGSMYFISASDLQKRLDALLTQHDHW